MSLQMAELLFLHVKSQHPTLRWWHFWLCMKIQKKRLEFKEQYSALLAANIFRMIFGGVIFIIPLMIGIQVSSKNEVNMSFLYKQKQISNVIQKEKYGKETVRLTNLISHLQSMALLRRNEAKTSLVFGMIKIMWVSVQLLWKMTKWLYKW